MRQFKNFNDEEFLNGLRQVNWTEMNLLNDPTVMWSDWLSKFSAILDIHALSRWAQKTRKTLLLL